MLTDEIQNSRNEPIPESLSTKSLTRIGLGLNKALFGDKPVDKCTKYDKTNSFYFWMNL